MEEKLKIEYTIISRGTEKYGSKGYMGISEVKKGKRYFVLSKHYEKEVQTLKDSFEFDDIYNIENITLSRFEIIPKITLDNKKDFINERIIICGLGNVGFASLIYLLDLGYKEIDILINNAATTCDTLFEDKTKDNFMNTLDINLVAPFLLCQKIGPKMKENRYGVIINISSTNGIDTPYIESVDYDASKAGLISLSNNLANYLAPYVRVNTICPGWINTNMNKNLDKEFINKEENKILLGRFGNPNEVAELVFFLVSDNASYINNSIIRIDGGKKC